MIILGSPFAFAPGTMQAAIDRLGLTSGLKLCLDASDINSYSGSGQSWLDTSGNGYDFLRGSTSASQATDPTFNGVAGAQSSSEYWSFDGGDYFTLGQANPTWVNDIHKNSAAATLAAWVQIGSASPQQFLAGTFSPSGTPPWFEWYTSSLLTNRFSVGNESGLSYEGASTATISAGAWTFLAVSVNEAGNSVVLQVNSTQDSLACTYSSPSSSSAGNVLKIGADGDAFGPLTSGSRMAGFMAWSTSLSAGSLSNLYQATKGKFGL